MKDDLGKYIERRKRTDREFAKNFETGYQEFKIGVLLRQAREEAGVTQELVGYGLSPLETADTVTGPAFCQGDEPSQPLKAGNMGRHLGGAFHGLPASIMP